MFKNTASQKIAVFAFDTATGLGKTGDAANITVYVSKDWGSVTALTDSSATEMDSTNAKGWYLFDVSQTETNADALLFTGKSSTSGISVVGQLIFTTPANFSTTSIDSNGRIKIQTGVSKNTAKAGFVFLMTDSTTHAPKTGVTVTATRSLDGASAGSCTNSATEIANGLYTIDLSAGDMNGNTVTLRFTGTASDDTVIEIFTTP